MLQVDQALHTFMACVTDTGKPECQKRNAKLLYRKQSVMQWQEMDRLEVVYVQCPSASKVSRGTLFLVTVCQDTMVSYQGHSHRGLQHLEFFIHTLSHTEHCKTWCLAHQQSADVTTLPAISELPLINLVSSTRAAMPYVT